MADIPSRRESSVVRVIAPVYLLLFPVPIVCFLAALATDLCYASTAYLMWLHFSEWLLAAGLAFGALAALALLVDFLANRAVHRPVGWLHLLFFYAALAVELVNSFVHSIDGWTAVVPNGLILSAIGALLALAAAGTLLRAPVATVAYREARP